MKVDNEFKIDILVISNVYVLVDIYTLALDLTRSSNIELSSFSFVLYIFKLFYIFFFIIVLYNRVNLIILLRTLILLYL